MGEEKKNTYRVRNWSDYNAGLDFKNYLKNRGCEIVFIFSLLSN